MINVRTDNAKKVVVLSLGGEMVKMVKIMVKTRKVRQIKKRTLMQKKEVRTEKKVQKTKRKKMVLRIRRY